jgi:hypothetical protein
VVQSLWPAARAVAGRAGSGDQILGRTSGPRWRCLKVMVSINIPSLKHALYCSISKGKPFRSFCVALVIGTILNLINQSDVIFSAKPIDWIVLTYLVPYAVSTYGAVSYRMSKSSL